MAEKIIKIVNLTPHDVTVVDENCRPVLTIPRSGVVARVKQSRRRIGTLVLVRGDLASADITRIPMVRNEYSEVEGLPAPQEGVYYIVSAMVAQAVRDKRDDVLYPDTGPGSACRDENGKIIGVRFLAKP